MRAERLRLALLLAAALPAAVAAADAPPPVAAAPVTAADAELLEFLGEFDDAKGEFVDPFVIDEVNSEVAAATREAERKNKNKPLAEPATQAAPPPPEKKP